MNIYVGRISYEVTDEELREAFAEHGQVDSATVIMDRYTGRSRGFGFVEMGDQAEAQAAIAALNGAELKGRAIVVNESKPREGGGGGGGGRGGGGGGGGGDRDYRPRY